MRRPYLAVAIAIGVAIFAPMLDAKAAPITLMMATQAATPATGPTRFSVEVVGTGPDVILIPGLSTPRAVWQPTADALKSHYRVHLVQVKGFGEPAGLNASGPILDPLVEDLAAYIKMHNLKNPAIIGHSMGGLAALMVAARYPDLPSKIMVADAVPFIGTIFNPAATVDMLRPQAESMRQMMLKAAAQANTGTPSAQSNANVPSNMSNSEKGRAQIAVWMQQADARVVAQAMYDDMVTDMRPELGKIKASITLLYAQDDRAITPERATATFLPQYKGVTKFTPVMIAGSFHFIMLDQPEHFAKEVEAFLKR